MSEQADHEETEPQIPPQGAVAEAVEAENPAVEASDAPEGSLEAKEAEIDATDAPEATDDNPKKRDPWYMRRIAELTAKNKQEAAERELLAARLKKYEETGAADGEEQRRVEREVARADTTLTVDQVRQEAERIVAEQRRTEAANRVFKAGVEAHTDFVQRRDALVNALGDAIGQRPDFVEAITELPNGHDVFHALGGDLDHAAEILTLPTARMAIELAKLSVELATPKVKPISSAPPPIKPLSGTAKGVPDLSDPTLPDDQYYALRQKQRQARWQSRH